MSRHFGQQSLEVVSIQRAIEYSKKKVSTVSKSANDVRIVFLLSKIPYNIRTVGDDNKIYELVEKTEKYYRDNHIFTARLPLPFLINQICLNIVTEYGPYTGKLLNAINRIGSKAINGDKAKTLWANILEHLNTQVTDKAVITPVLTL